MLTTNERKERRTHYLNRFRNRSFGGKLEIDQTETKEYQQIDRRIKNLEAELQESRHELYELNRAFDVVSREEVVRKAKKLLGVRDEVDALLTEVYERAQQCTKLKGADKSWKHRLPHAYGDVRQYVKSGVYGREANRRFHQLFMEYELMQSAMRVMWHDNSKKGQPLYERANKVRNECWERFNNAGRPIDKSAAA
jgi:hypothetical protein